MDQEKILKFLDKYMCRECYGVRLDAKCNNCGTDVCKGHGCSKKYRNDYHGYLCNRCWVISRKDSDGC